jgi:hypothetical protein
MEKSNGLGFTKNHLFSNKTLKYKISFNCYNVEKS